MKAKLTDISAANQLRKQAKIKLRDQKKKGATHPPMETDTQRLVHELEAHQIELEMQNEELVRARARAEAALKEYIDLYDFAPLGYMTLARDGAIQQANLAAGNLLGLERGKLLRKRLGAFVSKETCGIYEDFFEKLLSGKDRESCELSMKKNKGGKIWLRLTATCFEGGDASRATLTDITASRQEEQELKESERNIRILNDDLKQAQAVAHLGIWKWNLKTAAIEWSDEMYRIFGIEQDLYTGKLGDVVRKVIHPDDLHIVLPSNAAAFAANKPQEYRIIRPTDGSTRHIWAKAGEAIFDELGSPIYLTGVVQDATERKQAEEILQESEEKYRSLFENMTEGYAHCQMLYENGQPQDWIYLTVNKAFEGLTRLKDITGKRVSEVIPGIREADPQLFEIYSRVALGGKPEKFEIFVKAMQMWFSVAVYSPKKEYFVSVFDDITERKNFENELRQSEAKNRALLSAIPDLLFHIDPNGVVLDYHTPEGTSLYAPPEQFLNRNLLEVLPTYILQQGMAAFEEAIRANKMVMFEYDLPENGVSRFYENRVVPFSNNGVLSVVRDITERKQSGNAIRRHVAELELLYESGLALSQLLSPNQISEKIIDLLEYKMDWHHTIIRLYHPQDQSLELLAFNQSKNEAHTSGDRFVNHITKAGEGLTGWVVKNAQIARIGSLNSDPRYMASFPGMNSGLYVPMMCGQRMIGVISIETEKLNAFSEEHERLVATLANQAAVALENAQLYQTAQLEIDERKQIEALLAEEKNQLTQRVEERTADLSRTNRDLALAMHIKDEFLASMSHELRTPLTGILGLSEALQLKTYGVLSDKQTKTVKTIEESGRHLLELINDILDLSKIEAGMLELSVAPFLLEDICQSCLHLVKGMAQHKHQTVHYTPPMKPIVIEADARRIKQVLVNLLSNAVKFTPENGELGLEIRLDKPENRVQLSVWDKGIGIKAQDMQKLFKPFTQIDSSLAREYNGTGLGLSLAQRLIDKHNGSIEVESAPGAGSRFTVSLPWPPQETGLNSGEPETKQEFSAQINDESTPTLIMIADDNEMVLEMLADFLETKRHHTIKVHSGIELLEKIMEVLPDLMLVDIQMPGLDGLETIRRIRANPNPVIASTPLIAITALAMPGDRESCLQAGANEYMSKPVQ